MFDFGREIKRGSPLHKGSQHPGEMVSGKSSIPKYPVALLAWRTYDEILIMLLLHQRRLGDQFAETARVDLLRFAGPGSKEHQPGVGIPLEFGVFEDKEFAAVRPVDMFPHTEHVETVVLMSRVENQP